MNANATWLDEQKSLAVVRRCAVANAELQGARAGLKLAQARYKAAKREWKDSLAEFRVSLARTNSEQIALPLTGRSDAEPVIQ